MKQFAVLLAVALIPAVAWSQSNSTLPIYYGAAYGLVADDTTNNCSVMTTLLATAGAGGGGVIQLPIGNWTKLTNCNLQIPPNVIIAGSGNQGWNQGSGVVPSSGLHMTDGTHNYHIECLGRGGASPQGGLCGLENLEVLDDATSTPFMLYTCGVPYLRNVMFKGKNSANGTPKCASGGMAVCPVNDGIQFGTGGTGSSCGTDVVNTDGFNGYGANIIDGVYFQNIRTAVILRDNANGINFKRLWGDYTDANLTGYFAYINAPSISAYGNTFEDVDIEQAPNGSMLCNYLGAFGLDQNALQNQISYVTSDVGNCAHGAYILNSSSFWNDITNIGAYYGGNPAVSDAGTNYPNGIYDMPNRTSYRFTYLGTNLGTTNNPFTFLNLAVGGYIYGKEGTPFPPCAAGNVDCLWADSTDHRWKMNNDSGGAVDVGTVTNIGTSSPISGGPITTTGTISCPTCVTTPSGSLSGVAPIAITPGGAISLQNSASTNVTAALGTDTEYFTASGSAASANDIIVGDSSGGIKSNGSALPNGTTATTQSAGDNSTKVATTAYVDNVHPVLIYFFSATGTTTAAYFSVGNNNTTETQVEYPMDQGGTITSMTCRTPNNQGPGVTATLTLDKNASPCGMTVSWTNINGNKIDSTDTCTYSAGDRLDMSLTLSGTSSASQYMCTLTGYR